MGRAQSARMSALAMAVQFDNEIGIQPVLHMACCDPNIIRKRNRIYSERGHSAVCIDTGNDR